MSEISQFSNLVAYISTVIDLVLYFVFGVYAIFTAILYYHWQAYGTNLKVTSLTLITYFVTTIPLLIALVLLRFIII